jgi:diaminopimelate epimerase
VNVEFIKPEPDGSISMRVWERGVGETQACGTGASAVGAAAVRLGLTTSPVLVHLKGGDLEIEVTSDWAATMTGAAEEVYTGALSAELMARLSE